MISKRIELTLKECLIKVVDNRGKTPPISDAISPYPLIEVNAIVGAAKSPNFSAIKKFVTEGTYKNWFRAGHPLPGDIIFSTVGSIAEVALFEAGNGCIAQNLIALRPNLEIVLPDFLYYSLVHPKMQSYLKTLDISSVQPSIKVPHLLATKITIPSLAEQKFIGDFLSNFDSRINLLRETNDTLESIAQALFKSWFIDFDPVHAKARGLMPEGMDEATAELFPDSFEETELETVPKDWRLFVIYDLATFINGAAYKAFEPNMYRRGLPIIKIAELKAGVTENTAYSNIEMPKKYRIETGDILFSWSGNPDTSIDTFVWSFDPGWLNQHIFRVLPHQKNERAFVLQALRYLRPVFAELARNKQTTGLGHVTVADLKRLRITKPEQKILDAFEGVVGSIQHQIFQNAMRVNTLVDLRDTLLPQLISGQLRIADAETETENVPP